MNTNRIALTEYENNVGNLKCLEEGTKLYSPEYICSPDKDPEFKIHEFELKRYEKKESINHTEIDLNDESSIFATIVDVRFPNIEVPNQNLEVGFYLSRESAAWSFYEGMEEVVSVVKRFIDENDLNHPFQSGS